jgi:transcription initiation factor TFIID subunit 12
MLELADEFIDSAINFACRIAQHRGSDTLDVRDLQLHLGKTLVITLPFEPELIAMSPRFRE